MGKILTQNNDLEQDFATVREAFRFKTAEPSDSAKREFREANAALDRIAAVCEAKNAEIVNWRREAVDQQERYLKAKALCERQREALEHIQSMAGHPDPAEACRNIIARAALANEGEE